MEVGFSLTTDTNGGHCAGQWIEGKPEKRWWGLNVKGRKKLTVITYRCGRCGLLESYAEG